MLTKKKIIEQQKAIIMDLQEYHNELVKQNARLIKDNEELKRIIMQNSEFKAFVNIDFPNSEKGGSDHTGAVNVSDILQTCLKRSLVMKTFNKDEFNKECIKALSDYCDKEDFTGHENAKISILLSGMLVIHAIAEHLFDETDKIKIIDSEV